jgi:hypothetical protein
MKTIKAAFIGGLLFFIVSAPQSRAVEPVVFEAHELTLDGFGFYACRDKGGADKEAWGYGAGLNYFLTENIGLGADTYADAFTIPYLLNISGIYRFPLPDYNLAPYAIAGIGRQWDHAPQWLFHMGVGGEYRFQQNLGVFAELRGVFPVDTDPYALVRVGFRIRFQ